MRTYTYISSQPHEQSPNQTRRREDAWMTRQTKIISLTAHLTEVRLHVHVKHVDSTGRSHALTSPTHGSSSHLDRYGEPPAGAPRIMCKPFGTSWRPSITTWGFWTWLSSVPPWSPKTSRDMVRPCGPAAVVDQGVGEPTPRGATAINIWYSCIQGMNSPNSQLHLSHFVIESVWPRYHVIIVHLFLITILVTNDVFVWVISYKL